MVNRACVRKVFIRNIKDRIDSIIGEFMNFVEFLHPVLFPLAFWFGWCIWAAFLLLTTPNNTTGAIELLVFGIILPLAILTVRWLWHRWTDAVEYCEERERQVRREMGSFKYGKE